MLKKLHLALIAIVVSLWNISKAQNPNFNLFDPNENFYTTQARMKNYFSQYENELAKEQQERAARFNPNTIVKGQTTSSSGSPAQVKKLGGYKIYKRWEDFVAPRVYPSGDKTLISRAGEEYQQWLQQQSAGNAQGKVINPNAIMSTTWQPIGPFGDPTNGNAGRINMVKFDPSSSTAYWACAPDGGVWKTTNSGSSWSNNTDFLSAIGCTDVVFDPTNSQIMYMASGDGDAGDCYSLGVLKSTNGGLTWGTTGLSWVVSQGRRIHKLLINPLNKNTIFAATSAGLYRSLNAGTTWSVVQTGNINDIEYKPNDTTTIYAVSTSFFKSTNGGTSFTTITSGLPSAASNDRLAIAVTPANNTYVYVVAGSAANSGFLGFYQSTNSATTFTAKATSPNLLGWSNTGGDTGGQSWYDLAIAASPTNANEVIVGGVNIWRTTNAGTNWSIFAHWTGSGAPYVHADIHDLVYKNGTSIYVGCDGGVFYTTNSGANFFPMNGNMAIAQIYKIGLSSTTYSRAITGHQDNGTNLFTGTWARTMGGDGMSCFIDRTNDNVMYGEQYNGSFNRTLNGGASWGAITSGITGTGAWNTPWHQDPVVANTLYGGRQQMFKTTNQGTNWSQIGTLGGSGTIVEFAVAPSNTQVIYVIKGNALYKTTNGGTTWTAITGTLPVGSAQMTWVAVEDVDPNSVWVTFSGYSSGNKVFRSTNGGTSWTNYSTGLPNLPVNCITYWNGTTDGLYIGCDVGVYYRDSTMANWVAYNVGLPNCAITDLAIYYPTGKIRAATYGRSVWEVDLYNTGALAPIANFTSDKQNICPTMTVNFTDQSSFAPTSWSWIFQGGTPATSTLQNPSIVYNTAGTYSVQLTATNANGNSVMTKTLYINVSGPTTLPLVEGFQGAIFPPTNWQNVDAGSDSKVWVKSTTVGKSSTSSMWFDNYTLDVTGTRDEMRTSKYNFSGFSTIKMFFDVAYARYDATYSDSLEVLVSTDCGLTYNSVYLKGGGPVGGSNLATAPDKTVSVFSPTSTAQWRTDTVYLNAYAGQSNVMVSFKNRGHWGQALYLDNINIAGSGTALPPVASFSYAATNPCSGSNVFFSDLSTNTPTAWAWSIPGGSPASSTVKNPTVSFATSGTYTITLTSSNGSGTSTPVSQVVTVNPSPSVSVTNATVCAGTSASITASGASTYSWNTGAVTAGISVSPSVTTVYTVTGTTSGCTNAKTSTVTVNPNPTVTVNNATVCAGTSANLTASGATTYSWNTGATSTSISVSPSVTTVYTVTGTTTGCTNAKTSTVIVTPNPTVTVNNATVCAGTAANLSATGATSYSWNTGASTSTIAPTPSVTTVYTVTGTTSGCTNTKTSTVTVNASPTVAVSNATVCAGTSAVLNASGAATYSWNTGSTSASITASPSITTVYTVTGTSSGCTNTKTSTITVNALPSVSSNTASACSGNSATLTASGASTYTWSTGSNAVTIVVSPSVNTNYTVTGTSAAGCINSFVTSVSIGTTPTVSVNSSTICSGNSTNLTASGATTYSWNTGSSASSITVSPVSTTVYTVTGFNGGCTNVKTSTVTVNTTPTVSVNSATLCSGGSATLTASGAPTYSWNTGSTSSNIIVSPSSTTVYTVTGSNGSCSNLKTATVSVNTTPTVSVNSATICSGSSANLVASGAATYSWNTGSSASSINVSPTSTTTYTVTGNNGGCTDVKTAIVAVNTSPTVSVNSAALCSGGSATLTASGAATYSWNTGSTSNTIVVSPASTTVYTVTGTNASCSDVKTATVSVNTTPTVSVNSATICSGSSGTLTANGASTYSWSTGSTSNVITVSPISNTSYTVMGANGTCSDVQVSNVTVNPQPTVGLTVSSNTICTSGTGGSTISLSGSPSGGVYSGAGVSGSVFSAQATAGNYNVVYSYADPGTGCSNSAVMTISVNVCTGIAGMNTGVANINIYPNPNNGSFVIDIPAGGTTEVYNLEIHNTLGQLVYSDKISTNGNNEQRAVVLKDKAKGLYTLTVTVAGRKEVYKIVVE